MERIKSKRGRLLPSLFLLIYLLTVLWITVLRRPMRYQMAQFEVFWSYRRWLAGDAEMGRQILANIAMFVPFGFLLTSIRPPRTRSDYGKQTVIVVAAAAVLSLTIETLQLVLVRGLFESDDLMSNLLGALIGFCGYLCLRMIVERWTGERHFLLVDRAIGVAVVLVCVGVFLSSRNASALETNSTSRAYCFQIEEASCDIASHELELSGFAFRYDHKPKPFILSLRSLGTGERIELAATCGIARPDVNSYFACAYDYTDSGFRAAAVVDPAEQYEVMIRWPWSVTLSTGVYLSGSSIFYTPEETFAAPDGGPELDKIVENGTLRVYRPDHHCWVYQVGNSIYWIADAGFSFAESGSTYVQYQMWTTQIKNLPEERLARGSIWDNLGGYFEDYELTGDFGPYRVMKRELPTAYSVTSILTGYYKNGEWIWKNYFRPIYEFGGEA